MADGMIFDIQRYSIHDGPGIRTTVFFKDCPLRCRWCSNPESWGREPRLFYMKSRCISCGSCSGACPVGAISQGDEHYVIDAGSCIDCGTCADTCPVGAISQG